MRQVGYPRDGGVMVGNLDGNSFGASELNELGDIGKKLNPELTGIFVFYGVIKSDCPGGLLKETGVRMILPRVGGSSHGV